MNAVPPGDHGRRTYFIIKKQNEIRDAYHRRAPATDYRWRIDDGRVQREFGNEAVQTIGAFANTRGGTVLIGVTDQGRAVGCSISDETLREWANRIGQNSEPRIIPDLYRADLDGQVIVVIEVQQYPIRPIAVRGRYYRRIDRSNVIVTVGEIADLHLQARGTSWDLQPAFGASFADLDQTAIREYVRRANEVGRRRVRDHETIEEVLEKLSLAVNGAPTWGAVLLFGESPQRLLPQASIHCGVFRGGQEILDDLMIAGRLPDQVEDAMEFIRRNTRVRFEMTGDATRSQTWEYPLIALREAVVNAICHREYTIPSHVEVRIHEDRLEIWSPGRLPHGIRLQDLLHSHSSVLRNLGISTVLYDLELVERWGSGIQRMREACEEARVPPPAFSEGQGFLVTFRADQFTLEYLRSQDLNDRQIGIVLTVRDKGQITNSDIQKAFGVSKRQASDDLAILESRRLIERRGTTGRGTRYVLRGAEGAAKGQ